MLRASDLSEPSLVTLLQRRAGASPDFPAYSFLGGDEQEPLSLTHAELDRRARALGGWLQRVVAPGDRALLLFPPGLDFVAAFFGCLYGQTVAVPVQPPSWAKDLSRFRGLVRDAAPRVVLTTPAIEARFAAHRGTADLPRLRWQTLEGIEPGWEDEWRDPGVDAGTLAFLQYTSGSTGDPKGVQVSHGNLLSNQEAIRTAFGQGRDSVIVGWLPLYHDMGLIGNVLQPLYVGARCVLMAPTSFLQRPRRWLEAISRYGGTTSGGPNFAYDLCVRKVPPEQREGLDLSTWSVAFNGAEPVRAETLDRFARAFEPCGFRRRAFCPCYGLAEATLLVSSSGPTEGPVVRELSGRGLAANRVESPAGDSDAVRLVSCGKAAQRVVVVDPVTREECAPGRIGEIWVGGPGVAGGYFQRPEETQEIFGVRLAESGEGPFLRTGDLGFCREGEIFVTGRLKDLIILRGRNHYPQDIERTVEQVDAALRPGCGAAFSCDLEGEERLVVVHELDRGYKGPLDRLAERVIQAVAEEHEARVDRLVLIRAGSLPKTTSGKVQRRACREAFLSSGLMTVWASRPGAAADTGAEDSSAALDRAALLGLDPGERREALLEGLRLLAARALRLGPDGIRAEQPLAQLGLDSLGAVELQHALESRLGIPVSPGDLLEAASLEGLADGLLGRLVPEAVAEPWPEAGGGEDLPLSHGQEAFWFLHGLAPRSGAYHVVAAARVRPALDLAALRRALTALAERHSALRATFAAPAGKPWQRVLPRLDPTLSTGDAGSGADLADRLASEAFAPFDLQRGPLLRVSVLRSAGEDVLVLAAHHIVADFWSAGILTRELGALYARESGGPPPDLPSADAYGAGILWQRQRLAGPAGDELWSYWRERLADAPAELDLPTDRPRPPVQSFAGGAEVLRLDPSLSGALGRRAGGGNATLFMALLAAFQALLHRLSGQEDLLVGSPVVDRPRPELAGTVGYFINPLVLRTDLSGDPTGGELLERVRRTALAAFAHQGFPFPLLAERLQPDRDLSRSPVFQVMFTWLQARLPEESGLMACALGLEGVRTDLGGFTLESMRLPERWSQLDLNLRMGEVDGALAAWLQYSSDLFDAVTIRRLLAGLAHLISGLAEEPRRPLSALPLLGEAERSQVLLEWNDTEAAIPQPELVHRMLERQVDRTPAATAVVCGRAKLTYRELEERANRLARHLLSLQPGLGPDRRVGVALDRSEEMLVALFGVLKTGAAYVPLDPSYPRERLGFVMSDAGIEVLITQARHAGSFAFPRERTVLLEADGAAIAARPAIRPAVPCPAEAMAYLMYTSGSTGNPKGVMVTHRNVASFFAGMDRRLGTTPGCWLALTSISFDISVLELLWTLTRGWQVVVQPETRAAAVQRARRPPEMSLFYFASEAAQAGGTGEGQYRLLLEGARFADRHGFAAVWTPERHFHDFGGLYPNPAVTGAAVAAVTRRVGIRAGSVVLPLHHPLRVAEEWSVVDNISRGRAGISFATGWNATDFVFAPDAYGRRKELFREQIETVRRLWRGEALRCRGGAGEVEVRIVPRPVQAELPFWVTAAGSPETFRLAGELGGGLLTHLLGQTLDELAGKIAVYRSAWGEAGHPGEGPVVLMLHSFVGRNPERVRNVVREPFSAYLASSFDLMKGLAPDRDLQALDEADRRALVAHAFDRYFETSGLFGTPATCLRMVERLQEIGVDEIACLIDFGVDDDQVLEGLSLLDEVRRRSRKPVSHQGREETIPQQILRHGVTHLQCTPSAASAIVLEPDAGKALFRLHRLLVGGEALPAALAGRLAGSLTGELLNMYGPTETTIWSATDRVDPGAGVVTIGRPIANTQLHLLDGALAPVPVGRPGELYIGGDGVVRGYWRRPELTAERFVPDPFARCPGGRLYRTGDLARRQADGRIVFLGRTDRQVKVRGHRIELGEIEETLARHPAVREAAVLARADAGDGHPRLVAYVALGHEGGERAAREELAGFLKARLPEPMLPSVYVLLEALPQTPNGKVDRRALPAPGPEGGSPAGGYTAPRTPAEELLAGIYAELLRRDRIGRDDHFFEQGGHSLAAMQLAARVRAAFGIELPLRAIFETPTVGALAARIEQEGRGGERSTPPLAPVPRDRELPLSFAQERLWFLAQLEPESSSYHDWQAASLYGDLHPEVLERSLTEIVRRHEVLRTDFIDRDGAPALAIHAPRPAALPLIDLGALPESVRREAARRLAGAWRRRPFDLAHGPLLRTALLRLGPREHLVLLVLHHIVSDGWSQGLLMRELSALYEAFRAGRPSPLPELPVQYADFAAWQRRWLSGRVLERQLAYWRGRLAGALEPLDLPTDRPRPAIQTFRGATERFTWGRELAAALLRLCRGEEATPFMALLALFQALLSRHTGRTRLNVGTPIAGRRQLETEELIGCFVNTLVLRGDLEGAPSFRELLRRTREATLEAYAHQDLPFERLVEELQPERDLSRMPLFQALLAFQNVPAGPLSLSGLEMRLLPGESVETICDLALLLHDGDSLSGTAEYDRDLFDAPTVRRFLRHGATLLAAAVAHPDGPVADLPLLAPEERHQLMLEWSDTGKACPQVPLAHELFSSLPAAGRAPGNTRTYVLDPELRPVPIGVVGELYIGGTGLARRHPRSPDLTAGIFLPDPFVEAPGERLYRTGELARRLPDGALDFLGRRGRPEIERRASSEPSPETRESGAPRTPVEEMLAGIWAEALGIERVGVDESFFDLGGHSLLATRVASRLRRLLHVDLPLRALFEAPTIAQLARRIEREERKEVATAVPPADRSGPLPLSMAQERLWFLDQLEPGSAAYNIPSAFAVHGFLDLPALGGACREILRRHEVLRTTFAVTGGGPAQVIAEPPPAVLPLVDLAGLPASGAQQEVQRLAAREARRPFDLSRGPMLRLTVLRRRPDEHALLVTMHHIASDGWSMEILSREMLILYKALRQGLPSPLPELPIQYADFACWQRRWLASPAFDGLLAYWTRQLAGMPETLPLPADRPPRPETGWRGGVVRFEVPAELTQALKELSGHEGTTLFMTLVAAFGVLLRHWCGQTDLPIGTDVASRDVDHTEEMIGFFVNQVVLRADLSGDPPFRDLLARIREVALGAYSHQALPFSSLVKALAPRRALGKSPLFQVKLVLQNQPLPAMQVEGVRFEPLPVDSGTAKFDLLVNLFETEGRLTGWLEYRADLFEPETAAWLVQVFQALLARVAEEPGAGVEQLGDVLAQVEQRVSRARVEVLEELRRSSLKGARRQAVRV